MQLSLNLSNGKILPKSSVQVRSLDDLQVKESDDAAQQEFLDDFSSLNETIRDLAKIDGGDTPVHYTAHKPEAPGQLGWLGKHIPGWKAVWEQEGKDFAAYAKGGVDHSPEAGIVVTTMRDNRFLADAEMRFFPGSVATNGAGKNELLAGVESVDAKFTTFHAGEWNASRDFNGETPKLPSSTKFESIKYSNDGKQETYDWVAAGGEKSGHIVVDSGLGTLTYLTEQKPDENSTGFFL